MCSMQKMLLQLARSSYKYVYDITVHKTLVNNKDTHTG